MTSASVIATAGVAIIMVADTTNPSNPRFVMCFSSRGRAPANRSSMILFNRLFGTAGATLVINPTHANFITGLSIA